MNVGPANPMPLPNQELVQQLPPLETPVEKRSAAVLDFLQFYLVWAKRNRAEMIVLSAGAIYSLLEQYRLTGIMIELHEDGCFRIIKNTTSYSIKIEGWQALANLPIAAEICAELLFDPATRKQLKIKATPMV